MSLDSRACEERITRHAVVELGIARPQRLEVADEEWVRHVGVQEILLREIPDVAAVVPLFGQVILSNGRVEAIPKAAVVSNFDGHVARDLTLQAHAPPLHTSMLGIGIGSREVLSDNRVYAKRASEHRLEPLAVSLDGEWIAHRRNAPLRVAEQERLAKVHAQRACRVL